MRVVIAGCGYVGSALALRLVEAGDEVWALRRSDAPAPKGTHPLRADLRDREALRTVLPAALDAVVFAASAGGFTEGAYRSCYLDGLSGILGALGGRALRRLVFVSSTGVYGQDAGELVDEASPTGPTRFSGQVMLEAEELALASPHPTTVLRFGGIYGPGRTRFLDSVRRGTAPWNPERPAWTNRIHRDDGAAAIERMLALGDDAPARRIVVDDEPATRETVIRWMAERLGVAMPPTTTDVASSRTGGGGKRCSNRRLRNDGVVLRYPSFREGYEDMIQRVEALE